MATRTTPDLDNGTIATPETPPVPATDATQPDDWRLWPLDRIEIQPATKQTIESQTITTLGGLFEKLESGDTLNLKRTVITKIREQLEELKAAEPVKDSLTTEPTGKPDLPVEAPINRLPEAVADPVETKPETNGTHKPKKQTAPDDEAAEDLEELRKQEELIQSIESEMADLKEEYAAKKAEGKAAVVKLRRMVRESKEPNLFTKPKTKKEGTSKPSENIPNPKPDSGSTQENTAKTNDDETWRPVPLASLSLPKGIVEKLAGAGISNMGELVDYQKPNEANYCKQLTDIKGIGVGAAEKIGAATEQFWKERDAAKAGAAK